MPGVIDSVEKSVKREAEARLEEDVMVLSKPLVESLTPKLNTAPVNWAVVRMDFVMSPQFQSQRFLTSKYGVSPNNLAKHYRAEHWLAERERFRTEVEDKVKSISAQNLAITLLQWDRMCLQAAQLLLGSAMQELANGVPVQAVHAALVSAQKIGLEALGRVLPEGQSGEHDETIRILEEYADAIRIARGQILEQVRDAEPVHPGEPQAPESQTGNFSAVALP